MKYHLHITSSDPIGYNLLENVIAMANKGAVIKEGTIPIMRFPHAISMTIETDTPPTPTPYIRVFEDETNKEVFAAFVSEPAAEFLLDVEKVDRSLNNGEPWTKEQLDGMDWETEFKAVMADAGIGGKKKELMIKNYLAKFSK